MLLLLLLSFRTRGNIKRKIYVNIFIDLHGFENDGIKIA